MSDDNIIKFKSRDKLSWDALREQIKETNRREKQVYEDIINIVDVPDTAGLYCLWMAINDALIEKKGWTPAELAEDILNHYGDDDDGG